MNVDIRGFTKVKRKDGNMAITLNERHWWVYCVFLLYMSAMENLKMLLTEKCQKLKDKKPALSWQGISLLRQSFRQQMDISLINHYHHHPKGLVPILMTIVTEGEIGLWPSTLGVRGKFQRRLQREEGFLHKISGKENIAVSVAAIIKTP